MDTADLARRVLANDARGVARALRAVDDRTAGAVGLLKRLWPHTGRARVLGVTGNPGAGKSTLCDRLIEAYRRRGERVAVVAVDPSSPYSGGAILGDRIRMARHATDPGVFIRSLATRGHLGGLSRSARDVARVLDAAGYGVILVETVGVGQDELEITRTAHTTLVVVAPGLGDEVQAIKAGLLEGADVFAVNKADRDGADAAVRDLELMIALGRRAVVAPSTHAGHAGHGPAGAYVGPAHAAHVPAGALIGAAPAAGDEGPWTPPIVKCIATRGQGTDAVVSALDVHGAWLEGTEGGRSRRRARVREELRETLRDALVEAARQESEPGVEELARDVEAGVVDPYSAAEALVAEFRRSRAP